MGQVSADRSSCLVCPDSCPGPGRSFQDRQRGRWSGTCCRPAGHRQSRTRTRTASAGRGSGAASSLTLTGLSVTASLRSGQHEGGAQGRVRTEPLPQTRGRTGCSGRVQGLSPRGAALLPRLSPRLPVHARRTRGRLRRQSRRRAGRRAFAPSRPRPRPRHSASPISVTSGN